MRWIVDGMNVIGSRPDGWWRDRRAAMARLVEALEHWARSGDLEVTVVFEKPLTPPLVSDAVTVAHAPAPGPNSADDEIVRLVGASEHPDDVTVATSDRALVQRVRAAGASTYPAERLRDEIDPR